MTTKQGTWMQGGYDPAIIGPLTDGRWLSRLHTVNHHDRHRANLGGDTRTIQALHYENDRDAYHTITKRCTSHTRY